MKKYGYIYLTKNNINGKMYVGQKSSSKFIESYHGSGKLIVKAIEKYGEKNFSTEIIEWCYSREELDLKEIYWIGYFDAVNSDLFYNLQAGGQTGNIAGSKLSNETKKKLSESFRKYYSNNPSKTKGRIWITDGSTNKCVISSELDNYIKDGWRKGLSDSTLNNKSLSVSGSNNPMYGKHHSEDMKRNMSDKFSGEGNPFYGHKHSEETRRKLSEGRTGTKNPASGKKWIMKGTSTKRVLGSELQIYLDDGWKLGRYVSQETRDKQRENSKREDRRDKNGRFKSI